MLNQKRWRSPTIGSVVADAETELAESGSARLDADLLLARVLGTGRAHLYAHPERPVSARAAIRYRRVIGQRARGIPVAYLTGSHGFWSFEVTVNPNTLIPRPETEHLVETALALIHTHGLRTVVDLGTGSGAVALALKREVPALEVFATDISPQALAVARHNADALGLSGIHLLRGDWCRALAGRRFDLIISNPPYVASDDPRLSTSEIRFEPLLALDGGRDGLEAIRSVIAGAGERLRPGGWLAIEHGADQRNSIETLFGAQGFRSVACVRDYAGHERICLGRLDAAD
ncbi:MAG: peptide chain release factor N(5)-glutamine methyltransferase [Gammaproteobacteria bacterium]